MAILMETVYHRFMQRHPLVGISRTEFAARIGGLSIQVEMM